MIPIKHLGDITKIDGGKIPIVDVITGGSPCQDLSVAGGRSGFAGERSGLFMEQIRVVKEMRERDRADGRSGEFVRPRYMVWENVEGCLSSPGKDRRGEDFRAALEEIVRIAEPNAPDIPLPDKGLWQKSGVVVDEAGQWSIAWRLVDAQYWGMAFKSDGRVLDIGTPQRRKRVALVADFGGTTASEILFERSSLRGDTPKVREKGQKVAAGTGDGIEGASSFMLKVRGGARD